MVKQSQWDLKGPLRIIFLCLLFALVNYCWAQKAAVAWKFKTKAGIYSSPTFKENLIFFGSNDSILYALNRIDGKIKWKFRTSGKVNSNPTLHGEYIFVNCSDGSFYSIFWSNGKLNWKVKFEGEAKYDFWDFFTSSPTVKNNKVIFGSGNKSVYALEAKTGREIWTYETNAMVHANPIADNSSVYVGSYDGYFYALDSKTGSLKWKFKTLGTEYFPKGEIQGSAALVGNSVVFGSRDYNIYKLDKKTGNINWKIKRKNSWIIAQPLTIKKHIYVGTSDSHEVLMIKNSDGTLKKKFKVSMRIFAPSVNHNDNVIFCTYDGMVYHLNIKNEQLIKLFQTAESKINYSNVFKEDGSFRDDFKLYQEDYLETEQKLLSLGSIVTKPLIVENVLYVGDVSGNFYALKLLQ